MAESKPKFSPQYDRTATLTVERDYETLAVSIKAVVPNITEALDLARRAVDELEHLCRVERMQRDAGQLLTPAERKMFDHVRMGN